jgi:hypothetical protein
LRLEIELCLEQLIEGHLFPEDDRWCIPIAQAQRLTPQSEMAWPIV